MPIYTNLRKPPVENNNEKRKRLRVIKNLKSLRNNLIQHIHDSRDNSKKGNTVKIATWNIREFGNTKYKGRSYEELYYISEIISHFDIVALQEVRGDLKEFYTLKSYLGPSWDYVATDVTDGYAGNGERMIFLYNRTKVFFRNIAGELTLKENNKIRASFGERLKLDNNINLNLPAGSNLSNTYDAYTETNNGVVKLAEDLEIDLPNNSQLSIPNGSKLVVKKGTQIVRPENGKATVTIPTNISGSTYGLRFPENSFDDSFRQFARTPFLISFQSGWLKLNLCTVHIYYGSATNSNKLRQRQSEIDLLTEALANKAENEFKQDRESFLGVLGDFNIIGAGHPTMNALESNGFQIPNELKSIPGSNVAQDKAYDQIAFWKPQRQTGYSRLDIIGANVFDFFNTVFKDTDEEEYRLDNPNENGLKQSTKYKTWRTYKMSDHLVMWIELRTDFSDEYLDSINS